MLLAFGCAEPEAPGEDDERQSGAGCGDLQSECVDAETLWACQDRRWELVDCAQECDERGGVVGCVTSPSLLEGARCWCEDDVAACGPGQAKCLSDEVVQVCDPETLALVEHSCESVCGAMEPPRLARGCSLGACDCTLVGTPCDPESPSRCEPTAVARCVDGLWELESCLCSPGWCDPWAPGGPACDC